MTNKNSTISSISHTFRQEKPDDTLFTRFPGKLIIKDIQRCLSTEGYDKKNLPRFCDKMPQKLQWEPQYFLLVWRFKEKMDKLGGFSGRAGNGDLKYFFFKSVG